MIPVALKDIRGDGDDDDKSLDTLPMLPSRVAGETDQSYYQRRNVYFSQQISQRSVAYIDPHRGPDNSPDMPRLVARIPGAPAGLKVRWRLEVEYFRGNGYWAYYTENFTQAEDAVSIPQKVNNNIVFTSEMAANQEWRIFESQDWIDEIALRGFFGGTGKLYLWVPGQLNPPSEPVFTFRIGGQNPTQQLAREYIDHVPGAPWYAYAIARHETYGCVQENGHGRFYSQFYNDYQRGVIGDHAPSKDLAAWAKAWPVYDLDREVDSKTGHYYQNGAGGYGIFQLTWGPKHPGDRQGMGSEAFLPRRMIWNWQDNVKGAVQELIFKQGIAQTFVNALLSAYSAWGPLPPERHFSGLEATTVTFYNTRAGLRNVNKNIHDSPWTPDKARASRVWQFHPNVQDYVRQVDGFINSTVP